MWFCIAALRTLIVSDEIVAGALETEGTLAAVRADPWELW